LKGVIKSGDYDRPGPANFERRIADSAVSYYDVRRKSGAGNSSGDRSNVKARQRRAEKARDQIMKKPIVYKAPEITDSQIRCAVCGKWFKKITHAHLYRLHGLTIDKYKERFGYCRTQALEAFYIRQIRQACVRKYKTHKENFKDSEQYNFKPGRKGRKDKRRWQELYRLKKLNARIKGKVLVLTPAEIVCIFDLYRRLHYPMDRIAHVMHLSINYIRDFLKTKEDLYRRWKKYYIRKER